MDAIAAERARGSPGGESTVIAVDIKNLTLARGERTILSDVNASIREREFVGVFGPNGSGKTTLLQAILGLVHPTTGEIRVFDQRALEGNATTGYLPQKRSLVAQLRVCGWDFVASAFNGHRWGLPTLGTDGRKQVARVLEIVEATELAHRPLSQLSGGELQRLLLAQALLGEPKLLLLDEPLISLDPHYQQAVVRLIKRIQQVYGMTVLFTAHQLNPLLGSMDRVLYLVNGRAAIGAVDDVMNAQVLSQLYDMPIDVLRVKGRIVVLSALGEVDGDAHRHDV
jgi:zinc/manganese transport system ATP-binding protein